MNSDVSELLKQMLMQTVKKIRANEVGVAFSGGVDSSLLAKICKDVGKKTSLLTVGFVDRKDFEISSEVANIFGLTFYYDLVSLKDLEDGLKIVLSKIEFDRIVRFENCVCFYYVFRLASKQSLKTVVSANGMDELFCGYTVYKSSYNNLDSMRSLMMNLVNKAIKDKIELDKIAHLFNIDYVCPFLSKEFVEFAIQIPFKYKIKGFDDNLRKHILREVAVNVGVPIEAALRPKKAFQYSSGVHQAIRKMARLKNFTKNKAKHHGYTSEMEAYVDSLKRISHL